MSTTVKFISETEREAAMGVFVTTPAHWYIGLGEYAEQGEPDIEVRLMGAIDEGGNDISEAIASTIVKAIEESGLTL